MCGIYFIAYGAGLGGHYGGAAYGGQHGLGAYGGGKIGLSKSHIIVFIIFSSYIKYLLRN